MEIWESETIAANSGKRDTEAGILNGKVIVNKELRSLAELQRFQKSEKETLREL
jgi:hypothetical protein